MTLPNDLNAAIIEAYQAATPTVESTPDIVKGLAERFDMKQSAIRTRLVQAGVYLAQRRRSLNQKDKDWIASYFTRNSLTPGNRKAHTKIIYEAINAEENAIKEYLRWNVPYRSEGIAPSPPPKAGMTTQEKTRYYADKLSEVPQYTFEERLNGDAGWFSNPLWILNTIVMVFIVALVFVAIGSVFS